MLLRCKTGMQGFTMIEAIIAMFLVTVAFLGLASLTAVVINGNVFSKMSTTAAALANDKMEDFKFMSFTDSSLTAGAHSDSGNPLQALYTRLWNVTDVTDADNAKVMYKTITLTITWSWLNRSRSMSLNTLKANST